jgi:hypothetical protein
MHWVYATALAATDPPVSDPALAELPDAVDDGLLLQAASRARPAAAAMTATARGDCDCGFMTASVLDRCIGHIKRQG